MPLKGTPIHYVLKSRRAGWSRMIQSGFMAQAHWV